MPDPTQFGQLKRDDSDAAVGWKPINITTQTTTIVKASPGMLGRVVINTPVASGVVTIYNNTSATGTKIATITNPASLLTEGPISAPYLSVMDTGITIVTSGATQDVTVTYI